MQSELWYLIIFTGIVILILLKLVQKNLKKRIQFSYSKKPFMSESEIVYYQLLLQQLGNQFYIFAQVRLADFISTTTHDYAPNNRIRQKSVDFVLVDKSDRNNYMVIELDGTSHDLQERIDRDNFLDEVLRVSGIPVYHQKRYKEYFYPEQIKEAILATFHSPPGQ